MSLVASHQNENKMGEYNLAIVIGPNILRREVEDIKFVLYKYKYKLD